MRKTSPDMKKPPAGGYWQKAAADCRSKDRRRMGSHLRCWPDPFPDWAAVAAL